jgi:hypothetical protein
MRLVMGSPYPDTAQTKGDTLFKHPVHVTEIDAENKEDQKEEQDHVGDHNGAITHDRIPRLGTGKIYEI